MTRNAIVVSPHPMARECCVDAARLLADAAVRAGAPDGCVQVVEEPTIPLIEALMSDVTTDVIVATGGSGGRARGLPLGQPGDRRRAGQRPRAGRRDGRSRARAARCIVDSKAFDNSILCTNESVLIAEERIADSARARARQAGRAHLLGGRGRAACATTVFPDGHWRSTSSASDAQTIARAADIRVSPRTRVLVAPFALVVPEEPLAREKLFPVLGLLRVADATARHRRGAGDGAHRRRRALGGDPLERSAHDHGLRRRRQRAARRGQRGRQHRLVGLRHEPRAVDDDRHRASSAAARSAATSSRGTS